MKYTRGAVDSSQIGLIAGVLGVTVLIIGGALFFMRPGEPVLTIPDPSGLAGLQSGQAPWIAETDNLKARLNAIGLPALSAEGNALHIHQHLEVFVNGQSVTVPPGFGINTSAGFISSIHSHDTRGVIHVESPVVADFTLGQVFDIWGVKLTRECIGGYCTEGEKTLQVFVDGELYSGDPRTLVLTSHQQIVVAYGTPADLPNPIPASFTFAEGE